MLVFIIDKLSQDNGSVYRYIWFVIVPIFRLIGLAIRAIQGARTKTEPVMRYERGFKMYDKAYFDEYYLYQFYKFPLGDMPKDIEYYNANIGHITLVKRNTANHFEIYETNLINDKELAMNVRMVYGDMVMTGLQSSRNTVVTRNEYFVLAINDKMDVFQVRSSMQEDNMDKTIKSDFGEYLIRYLIKERQAGQADQAPSL